MFTFNNLPFEIRAQIRKLTVEPRTVEVTILWEERPYRLASTTPMPAALKVCQEARNMELYKQVFSELGDGLRYVWLNLDIDMVSISNRVSFPFKPVAHMIKRLKFQRGNQEECFYHFESKEIRTFVNAEEIHVICEDGYENWGGATWPGDEGH
ncbi:hypothetical protein VC83_02378 [Pseudogymnoascus destructans]|uniref:2EXR domain-containing protein n=1 Tax=Pseudogymnoascus destructans TaxID=655981 RepID=A0A177AGE5_9PEZI|nr:uncharacterized protein VC83_02378 [Pseudogymnoascus destructans]OAF61147.1 hypothetical protein VC83_02378 [Pseudogymnoascus destructans]